MASRREL
ncbi:hypothetical protein D030_4777A, partial [Vibrio parahaemolyticus AQ3810]